MDIKTIKETEELIGNEVSIKGWVRTLRDQKKFAFVQLNDGSCLSGIQVVMDPETEDFEALVKEVNTGSCIEASGELVQSPGKGQSVELKAKKILIHGLCDVSDYPLQKKRHSLEFLRTIAHLRTRTNTYGAIFRLRSALSYATHKFFNEAGFMQVHTPVITASDCEGAGELFRVSTLDEAQLKKSPTPYEEDFFGKAAFLTCSGQLNAEVFATSFRNVYTFGPTFRAENSNTTRHLAEFWMLEPEIAFADLSENIKWAQFYMQAMVSHALEYCSEDLEFFNKYVDETLIDRLKVVLEKDFARVTYTEAISILEASNKTFNYPVSWGIDLQTEHERYLSEEHFKGPVVVTDYPKEIKAFYMRMNDDHKTVAAMDILVPGIGELIGGSQREERHDVLKQRILESGLELEPYQWYLDLRRYGTVTHSGFGLGFERMIQWISGIENIRDVIPFPRYPGHSEF